MIGRASIGAHPWRWLVATVIVLILMMLIGATLFVRSLLQPQRFTALLQSQLAGAGLILSVEKPAAPALWPHPAVQLQGFQLSSIGSNAPLLTATQARMVVPWHALLHRELAIERLEIESPRIDLDQLQALLSKLPQTQGAPQLPHIGAGLQIVNGTLVRNDEPQLFDIHAETGTLLPGIPFQLDAAARSGSDRSGILKLTALPRDENDALRFDRVHLILSVQRGLSADLAGNALWRGGSDVAANFTGTLKLPAAAAANPSSAASAAANAGAAPTVPRDYAVALQILPAQKSVPLVAALKLEGSNEHVDARIPPLQLVDWWHGVLTSQPGTPLTLPPLQGRAHVETLSYGPLQMHDVQVDAGPDVAPLPAGSAPAPASAATAKEVAH